MIAAPVTNLRQDVGTSRGGAQVQLQQTFSQRFGLLPIAALKELFSFGFRAQPFFGLVAVEQWRTVVLGCPVSEIELRQHEHDRDTTLADDLSEQAQCLSGVCNQKGLTRLFYAAPRTAISKRVRHVEQLLLRRLNERVPIVAGEDDKRVGLKV